MYVFIPLVKGGRQSHVLHEEASFSRLDFTFYRCKCIMLGALVVSCLPTSACLHSRIASILLCILGASLDDANVAAMSTSSLVLANVILLYSYLTSSHLSLYVHLLSRTEYH